MQRRGVITASVVKLARESAGLTQEQLAAALGAERTTIQGWETARRPFTAVPFGRAVSYRSKLVRLGAHPALLAWLDDAAEADFVLGEVIGDDEQGYEAAGHPLGSHVLTRSVVELIGWAVTGARPQLLSRIPEQPTRRGPVAPGPDLGAAERAAYTNGLRELIERSSGSDDDSAVLLHRQACYLAGPAVDAAADWLQTALPRDYLTKPMPWSPRWSDARTVSIARAVQGDVEPLRDFLRVGFGSDEQERANLNYWAYYAGELTDRQHSDHFQVADDLRWRGTKLLAHLVNGLRPDSGYLALSVHTIGALLLERRGIAHDEPAITHALIERARQLLDGGALLPETRTELSSILYHLQAERVQWPTM